MIDIISDLSKGNEADYEKCWSVFYDLSDAVCMLTWRPILRIQVQDSMLDILLFKTVSSTCLAIL